MNLEDLGQWLLEHPHVTRGIAIGFVVFSTACYFGTVRNYVRLDQLLKDRASDAARAASEALGG